MWIVLVALFVLVSAFLLMGGLVVVGDHYYRKHHGYLSCERLENQKR